MNTKHLMTGMFASLVALHVAVAHAEESKPAKPELTHVATCNDGKEYYAKDNDHRFACAGHKGVASWADGSPVRAKAERKGTREYR